MSANISLGSMGSVNWNKINENKKETIKFNPSETTFLGRVWELLVAGSSAGKNLGNLLSAGKMVNVWREWAGKAPVPSSTSVVNASALGKNFLESMEIFSKIDRLVVSVFGGGDLVSRTIDSVDSALGIVKSVAEGAELFEKLGVVKGKTSQVLKPWSLGSTTFSSAKSLLSETGPKLFESGKDVVGTVSSMLKVTRDVSYGGFVGLNGLSMNLFGVGSVPMLLVGLTTGLASSVASMFVDAAFSSKISGGRYGTDPAMLRNLEVIANHQYT